MYLCLEDTFQRVQKRLWTITDVASESFFFANAARSIGSGLCGQLQGFKQDHPNLRLVFIDTFQMVRDANNESLYAADYGDLTKLKKVADAGDMAIVVIHHTRKMGDSDALNTVSGTTGITGSADSTLVLHRQTRSAGDATLTVTGRDMEFQELKLRFKDCRWELLGKTNTGELEERDVPNEVLQVVSFMDGREKWGGSARELSNAVGIDGISAAVLGKYLAQHQSFLASRGIAYSRKHARSGNVMELVHIDYGESSEGSEG